MTEFGLGKADLVEIIDVFKTVPEIEEAVIFGSRAKGNYRKGSDVDIALKGVGLTSEIVNHVHWLLEEETKLPYFFDIVDYKSISNQALREHVDRCGKSFYKR